jgi:hypothetical protein
MKATGGFRKQSVIWKTSVNNKRPSEIAVISTGIPRLTVSNGIVATYPYNASLTMWATLASGSAVTSATFGKVLSRPGDKETYVCEIACSVIKFNFE